MALNAWEALSLDRHGFIQASAGTGKTYTIENLAVRILTNPDNPVDLEKILIVTYTEKATAELRYRIRAKLTATLAENASLAPLMRAHVEQCITRFDRAAIFTIHGFCSRYLSAHAFESRAALSAQLGDADSASHAVLLTLLRTGLRKHVLASGERMQRTLAAWGLAGVRQFLDVAGKILSRLNCDAGDEVLPYMADRDGRDMRERLEGACEAIRSHVVASSGAMHPFLAGWDPNLLKAKIGLARKPTDAMIEKRVRLVREVVSNFPAACDPETVCAWTGSGAFKEVRGESGVAGYFLMGGCTMEQLSRALPESNGMSFGEFAAALQTMVSCAASLRYQGLAGFLREASVLVRQRRARDGVTTYDDMVHDMYRNIRDPSSELLAVLRKQFRYGIIDEFQDTNAHQWDIFRRIFVDDDPSSGPRRLYVVGDPKQSIFSFQGAEVNVYHEALRTLSSFGALGVPLAANYRSSFAMVDACNRLFSSAQGNDWFAGAASGISYENVQSGGNVAEAALCADSPAFLRTPIAFCDVSDAEGYGFPTTKRQKSEALARWICSTVAYLTREEEGKTPMRIPAETGKFRNIVPGDICILVERHSEAAPVMRMLRETGIPYTKQRNTGLFASDECLHLLAALDAIDNSEDPVAVKKALLTGFFGVSPADLDAHEDLYSGIFRGSLEKLRRLAGLRDGRQWGQLFAELYYTTDLLPRIARRSEPLLRVAAYRQLRTYSLRFLIEKRRTLAELVARLRLLNKGEILESQDEDVFNRETEGDAVQILTMFSAKGLEFPVVFVAGGKSQEASASPYYSLVNMRGGTSYWLDRERGKAAASAVRRQELRRVYYVACTRAKYRLFVPLWDGAASSRPAGRADTTSASALFLARHCREILAKGENAGLFSLVGAETTFPRGKGPAPNAEAIRPVPNAVGEWKGESMATPVSPSRRATTIESYSGLARMAGRLGIRTNPGADESHEPAEAKPPEDDVLISSAETGDALHAVLEQADFSLFASAASSEELCREGSQTRRLVEDSLRLKGLLAGDASDEPRIVRAARIVANSLTASFADPAGAATITLADIPAIDRTSEAEFHFTFNKNGIPFQADSFGGWVLGFMDMLFRREGRYYLLDWKSNRVQGSYTREDIDRNMREHGYDIQYKMYGLALHRLLATRLKRYKPEEHFGGVVYMYLRGTRPGQDRGIWSMRPSGSDLETGWPEEIGSRLRQRLRARVEGII